MPTRLLDWSRNPLIAIYFAVKKDIDEPSVIYVLNHEHQPLVEVKTHSNLEGITGDALRYLPSHVTERIIVQNGLFTFHPDDPSNEYDTEAIEKIIIPAKARKRLKKDLYRYGVHEAALFPGLDGLAQHIKWMNEKSH